MTDGNDYVFVHDTRPQGGSIPLTKREYYTGLALQGLLAIADKGNARNTEEALEILAEKSVKLADVIIEQLNKP